MTELLNLSKDTPMLDLTKLAPSLRNLRATLNWDMHPVHGRDLNNGFDLDIFVFVLNQQGKITGGQDVVFFNNKVFAGGAVSIPLDNRTGEGSDDEYADFDLSRVPSDKHGLDIYVFIHDAEERGQRFEMMANAHLDLIDQDTGKVLAEYKISQFTNETALHVGRVVRNGSGWGFEAFGEASRVGPNQVAPLYM